jgi:hypothetical protein
MKKLNALAGNRHAQLAFAFLSFAVIIQHKQCIDWKQTGSKSAQSRFGGEGMGSRKAFLTRRRVAGAIVAIVAVPPVARIALLRLRDNPLPRVAEPEPVLVGRWLLDASDLAAGPGG